MDVLTNCPRGTQDILPKDSYKWQFIQNLLNDISQNFGYKEMRTPIFEHTELFQRSVGDTTDVVQKEMYTFKDKGDRSITLKPEGTAGVLRCSIEHGLTGGALPLKYFYLTSCFRYEKPQAGRFRQFNQFGVEMLGSPTAQSDVDVIMLAQEILESLEIQNVVLEINSIGCPSCRPKYQKALLEYFENKKDKLCPTCLERLEKNPMRILDCKSEICSGFAKNAPTNLEYLCADCQNDFENLKNYLNACDISFIVNPRIVRGLDYYTKTVFEFITTDLGSQSAVCAGGRYNGLIKSLGGPDLPGVGFAMGLERIIMLLDKQNFEFKMPKQCDIYFAPIGEKAIKKAMQLTKALRSDGFYAEYDLMNKSIKAQMKYANKINAKFSVVIGDDEIQSNKVLLKNMVSGETKEVNLNNDLITEIYDAGINDIVENITHDFKGLI